MASVMERETDRAREVLEHLCGKTCHGFAEAVELCETRGDCVYVVTCPDCGQQFTLSDEEFERLELYSAHTSDALACGILPL